MYDSPIKVMFGQMESQIDNKIMKAIQQIDIEIDKEELVRALQYDRGQYDRGFADGYMVARSEFEERLNDQNDSQRSGKDSV